MLAGDVVSPAVYKTDVMKFDEYASLRLYNYVLHAGGQPCQFLPVEAPRSQKRMTIQRSKRHWEANRMPLHSICTRSFVVHEILMLLTRAG